MFLESYFGDFPKRFFFENFWNFFTSIASSLPISPGPLEMQSDSSLDEEISLAFAVFPLGHEVFHSLDHTCPFSQTIVEEGHEPRVGTVMEVGKFKQRRSQEARKATPIV